MKETPHSRIQRTVRVLLIGFSLATALCAVAWAGSEQVLYQFKSPQDGQHLLNGVLLLNGKIYGVTYEGGTAGWGTVFELTRGKTGWTKKTLYNFTRGKDGGLPITELAADKAGNLYGTTTEGGSPKACQRLVTACGTVFVLTHHSDGWKEAVIHDFNGKDGAYPEGNLVWDDAGNLYGTASGGKSCGVECGDGTVFKLSMGLHPFVRTVPTAGEVGAQIRILGSDLTGATSVTFNGTAAAFTVTASSLITATVPAGATTGRVRVVIPEGTLTSNAAFQVE